ncbi:uncharacterized protein LOC142975840 [Anticarsia gemmatalis]|uniref:uncharacterized protein LOC142975840 n=1 Tax=Anticarsia gemmatalis TaxID=129554 RepID=UPI003F7574FE
METRGDEENDFSEVIDNLVNMFGNLLNRDAIATIVESCSGDLNLSVDAIMNITSESTPTINDDANTSGLQNAGPSVSYASAAVRNTEDTGAAACAPVQNAPAQNAPVQNVPVQNPPIQNPPVIIPPDHNAPIVKDDFWTDQLRHIMSQHTKGYRIMIIMRGAPGSGKSYLAKRLVEMLIGSKPDKSNNHIFSTDDYFMYRRQYHFDKNQLHFAHAWNFDRVKQMVSQGVSPVIVDNTNTEIWEMQPYAIEAVRNGYIIELVEPHTPWARKANQLSKKNVHRVPLANIKRMLDHYVGGVTGESLMLSLGLSYPAHMVPPVMRLIPPVVIPEDTTLTSKCSAPTAVSKAVKSKSSAATGGGSWTKVSKSHVAEQNTSQNTTSSVRPQELLSKVTHVEKKSTLKAEATITVSSDTQNVSETPFLKSPKPPDPVAQTSQISSPNNIALLRDKPLNHAGEPEPKTTNANEEAKLVQETSKLSLIYQEATKKLEEFQKVEEEWENGEQWEKNDQGATTGDLVTNARDTTSSTKVNPLLAAITMSEAKPPRKERKVTPASEETLMTKVNNCQDWHNISLFMPPWVDPDEQPRTFLVKGVPIKTATSSTCIEIGDTNLYGKHKIISTTSRDINEFYEPPQREKIPIKRMLDKSTTTNDGFASAVNCPQKERHFVAFTKLFNNIKVESLRYIFDNCCGNVNWAVENVLGGAKYELKSFEDTEQSEPEEELVDNNSQCICFAEYDLIPNTFSYETVKLFDETNNEPEKDRSEATPQSQKKKRDAIVTNDTIQLKRQIEQNVTISDNHYSEHCLKIRKMRRGEYTKNDGIDQPSTSGTATETDTGYSTNDGTAQEVDNSDDEECANGAFREGDKIINVNVGKSLIKNLDEMFGRKDMEYPECVKFNISIPTSLLNEINALWMESLMFQLDEHAKTTAALIKADEAFARQIARKEHEASKEGEEGTVPNLKEIMDLELALSIHLKDTSEWRNNIPTDIAAKMTQEKLYNLFPDIERDTLLEMLIAHGHEFNATVEVLLLSMGRNDILEADNGINKFIMEKELERQEKLQEDQRKEMLEMEFPLLHKEEYVDMDTVDNYREEAEKHLIRRNLNLQKASDYIKGGVPEAAVHCSELAQYHKRKYEQASSLAVSALIQHHARNNSDGVTIDLHYLRVKEAKEAMDIFIDSHIQNLRKVHKRSVVLYLITGRGLHSPGRPKVKPACINRLKERNLSFTECNPGLISTKVTCDDKLVHQIS